MVFSKIEIFRIRKLNYYKREQPAIGMICNIKKKFGKYSKILMMNQ